MLQQSKSGSTSEALRRCSTSGSNSLVGGGGGKGGGDIPLVDGLLVLLVRFDEPLADADEAAVHEAALQQVVDGFEEQRATFVREAVLP